MPYLLILPVAYLLALLAMQTLGTPYWLWNNIDPSYFYLLNGLEVALGQSPADFHHPGTTTQVIAGLALRLAHPLLSGEQLTDAVLSNPEQALHLIAHVDNVLIALSMLWAGFEARKVFGGLTVPALFVQATPFLSTVMLVNGYTVKPEATLIVAGSALSALLCRAIACPSPKVVAGIGVALAFALVTKLHALSLFAVPLFLIQGRARIILGLSVLGGIALFTSPIWERFDDMRQWYTALATHNGSYGEGEAGLLPDHYLWNAIKQLRRPIFSVPLVCGLVVLWLRRRTLTSAELPMARTLCGVLLSQIVHLLLVAKHPISYYLIPAFLMMGMGAALTITLARPLVAISDVKWRRAWQAIAALLVVTQTLSIVQAIQNRMREKHTAMAMDMSAFSACTKINIDFASDQNFALLLGNWMAEWRFKPWLAEHLPADTYMWVPVNGFPQQGDAVQTPWSELFKRASCTVVRGAWGESAWQEIKRNVPEITLNACSNGDEWVLSSGIACESAFPGIKSTVSP